ncbi:hypothetical protein V8G54_002660, partial [Vigna mungo]
YDKVATVKQAEQSKKIMGSTNLVLSSTLLLLLVGFATSDINQDKADCTDKLVGLAGCLPYVGGGASAPTMDCCSGLKQVIDKNKRCLCVLIKDRDDPSLGLTINVTLALKLPDVCKTPTNITQCVDLLHLQPNSPDAKVFEGLEKALTNKTSPSSGPSVAVVNRQNLFCNGTTIKWCEQEIWRVGKEVGGDRSGMWNFTHSVCIPIGVVDGLKVEDGRLVVVSFNVVVSCVVHRYVEDAICNLLVLVAS